MKAVIIIIVVVLLLIVLPTGCTYNTLLTKEEAVSAAWSEVQNQYQRRFDLIPNLVSTVKGYASHEQETFQAVTEARAKVGGMVNIDESILNDPDKLAQFQQAQSSLGSALQRLMVVQERYPDLKANENFRELQSQLEGTENRITVARMRFNEAAKGYNISIRRFPANIMANMFGFEKKAYFEAAAGAETAPQVEF